MSQEDQPSDSSDSECLEWLYAVNENTSCSVSSRLENTLKYSPPQLVRRIYLLGRLISKIFEENSVLYWISGGTALGTVRHKGLIPWDDDLDICIDRKDVPQLQNMKSKLARENLVLSEAPSIGGYRIFHSEESEPMPDDNAVIRLNYRYPFCDVFVMRKSGDKYFPEHPTPRILWPNEWYYIQDVQNSVKMIFGDFFFNCAANIDDYLNRLYGDNWATVASTQDYIHTTREYVRPVKFELTSAAMYEPARPFQ